MASVKLKEVTVFFPNGKMVAIPGQHAAVYNDPSTGVLIVEQAMEDGGRRKFLGLAVCIETHPTSPVDVVPVMPSGLVGPNGRS